MKENKITRDDEDKTILSDLQEAMNAQFKRADAMEERQEEEWTRLNDVIKGFQIADDVQSQRSADQERKINNMATGITGFLEEWKRNLNESLLRMEEVIEGGKAQLKAFPKNLTVDLKHRFERHTRVLILTVIASIIITAVSLALSVGVYRENNRLVENDLKYRYFQLEAPSATFNTDSIYNINPDSFREKVEYAEAEKRTLYAAELTFREKKREADAAKEQAQKLRQQNAVKPTKVK